MPHLAATVWIFCRHHKVLTIGRWDLMSDGHVLVADLAGLEEVYVGDMPTASDREAAARLRERSGGWSPAFAVDQPAAGGVPHFRYRLRCPRPTCGYAVPIRDSTAGRLDDLLRALASHGKAEIHIDMETFAQDPDRLIRRVAMSHDRT